MNRQRRRAVTGVSRSTWWIGGFAFGVLLSVASLPGCGGSEGSTVGATDDRRVVVELVELVADDTPARLRYAGEVVAMDRFEVASKVMGRVVELPAFEGARVARGDVLVRIDAPELESAASRARAEEEAARIASETAGRHAERYQRLEREGVVTTRDRELAEIDAATARARYEGAAAARRLAERNAGYAEIRSDVDGVVVQRLVRAGDLAAPGRPLLVVEGREREIRVGVPSDAGVAIEPGADVRVRLGAEVVAAVVHRVSPDAARHVRMVYVRAEELASPTGTFVRVAVVSPGAGPAVRLPEEALRRRGSLTSVFVVTDGRAVLRYVRLDDTGRVLAGLEAGEHVIVRPPSDLRDGDPVVTPSTEEPAS